MAYPKELNPRALEILKPQLKNLEALKSGESLTLEGSSESYTTTFRSNLYAWLSIQELTSFFKVRRVSPTELHIERLSIPQMKVASQHKTSQEESFVKDHLLELESEEEVIERMSEEKGLPAELKLKIIQEWKRINGL